jgi:hypothetical protein
VSLLTERSLFVQVPQHLLVAIATTVPTVPWIWKQTPQY